MSHKIVVPPMPTVFDVDCPEVVFEEEYWVLRDIADGCWKIYKSRLPVEAGLCFAVSRVVASGRADDLFYDAMKNALGIGNRTYLHHYLGQSSEVIRETRYDWVYHIARFINKSLAEQINGPES